MLRNGGGEEGGKGKGVGMNEKIFSRKNAGKYKI